MGEEIFSFEPTEPSTVINNRQTRNGELVQVTQNQNNYETGHSDENQGYQIIVKDTFNNNSFQEHKYQMDEDEYDYDNNNQEDMEIRSLNASEKFEITKNLGHHFNRLQEYISAGERREDIP